MIDVKTQAILSVKKDDRIHEYHCAHNTNLGEIFDVLQEMKAYIVQRINEAQQAEVSEQPKE